MQMCETVFTQVVGLYLRSNIFSTIASRRIGSNQHHLSAAHRFAAFIRHTAINHGLGMQPKNQVLRVLTVPNSYTNEECTMLIIALADVARRGPVEHVFPRLESSKCKSPIVSRGGSSCVVAKGNRNLRARHRPIGHGIHNHATDAISGRNLALRIRLSKQGQERQSKKWRHHCSCSSCFCTSAMTVTFVRGPKVTSVACARYRSITVGL